MSKIHSPSKHPTLYDVIIWLVLGWLVNNQKPTLVQRHYMIRIQRYNLTLTQRYLISDLKYVTSSVKISPVDTNVICE